jgi:high-affinity Fe2+/Pb2+ permease
LWWLFNAYPAASELADKQHQNDVVLPLVAVLLTSAAVAAMLRIGWMLAARRWRWREALTSPWMWVIAGGMCLVEFLGQVGRHG